MKRSLLITTYISAILLTVSSNFAFAENSTECNACNTTSPYVDNYINFANELIKTFQTYANQEAYTFQQQGETNITNGANQINTNTEGQFVKTDISRQLQSITDNLNQKAQSAASSLFVFGLVTTESVFLDSWKSISPLLNGKAILRDWEKIETIGQGITNTLLDMGNNGIFERLGFREGWNTRIEEILNRYSTMSDSPIYFKEGARLYSQPREILGALWAMNQALKTTIGIGRNDIIDNVDNKFLDGQIMFSQAAQDNLVNYYSCARGTAGISCSKAGSRAKENLQSTWSETTSKTKDAKKIITDALKRLSGFRSNNGGAKEMLKQRQNELLRSEYGRQGVRNNQGETIGQGLKNGLNNAFGFKETRKTLKNDATAIGPFAGLKETNQKLKGEPFIVGDYTTKKINAAKEDTLRDTFNNVILVARNNWKESTYGDVSQVTKLFPMITTEIVSSRNIIDSKSSESIVENLGKACDQQCRNLGGKCRYQ